MSLTLAVVDNANGTGATATVSGSAAGTVSIYAQQVTGAISTGAFSLVGSRTGNGTVVLALAKGYWLLYCTEAPASLSGLAYVAVTDGTGAVYDRVFDAVKSQLQLIALSFTTRVYDYGETADPSVTYPCTLISTQDGRQTNEAALNGRDDWGWPVRVIIRDIVVKFDTSARARFRLWRQAVTRAFVHQRLPGVPESVICKVEAGALMTRVDKLPNVAETELVIRAITREVRGLGA